MAWLVQDEHNLEGLSCSGFVPALWVVEPAPAPPTCPPVQTVSRHERESRLSEPICTDRMGLGLGGSFSQDTLCFFSPLQCGHTREQFEENLDRTYGDNPDIGLRSITIRTSMRGFALSLCLAWFATTAFSIRIGGGPWDRIGPHNIFNAYNEGGRGPLPMGEAGTLEGASSLASAPHIIYAGGQNNGVSSGIIKTVDGGQHWERKSKGMWDTRVLGVWVSAAPLHSGFPLLCFASAQCLIAGTP